ncbi:MAG: hypothetical protein IKL05_02510 [Clostridia bacterium]|nr:hypothetical protein [Clostridia bacterium]
MAKKQSYSYKTKRSDTLTNRMMIVFVLLLLSVFALLSVRNWLGTTSAVENYDAYIRTVRLLPILPLVLTVASAVYLILCKKNQKNEEFTTLSSSFLLTVSAVFLVVALIISRYVYIGYVPAIIFVILVSLLYFIAVSFPGSYLIIAIFNALGAFAIYALNLVSAIDSPVEHYVLRALAVVVAVAFAVILGMAKKNGGELFGMKIMKKDADYLPVFISVAVFALFIILGALGIGSYVIYDVIIALETIIFALFYAIKMLK